MNHIIQLPTELSLGEQLLQDNNMLWQAEKQPIFIQEKWKENENNLPGYPGDPQLRQLRGYQANIRNDTGALLGVTGSRHTNYQNRSVIQLGDILADGGEITWQNAGMFKGGRKCYAQAKLPQSLEVVPGDKIDPYLTFTWAHDGSGAFQAFLTYIRIFCQNQSAAIGRDKDMLFKFRHTKSIEEKTTQAAELINKANSAFQQLNYTTQQLVQKRLTIGQFNDIVHELYPDPDEGDTPTKTTNIRDNLHQLFVNGVGQQHPGVQETAWAGLNAITEFTTHHKMASGKTNSQKTLSRLESTFSGHSAKQEQTTLELLLAA